MSDIKIDYDGLSQASASLKNYAAAYDSLCARMKSMSDQISATWEGNASRAFVEMMQKYQKQGLLIKDIIATIEGYAQMTGSDFQAVDQECAARIRNSF